MGKRGDFFFLAVNVHLSHHFILTYLIFQPLSSFFTTIWVRNKYMIVPFSQTMPYTRQILLQRCCNLILISLVYTLRLAILWNWRTHRKVLIWSEYYYITTIICCTSFKNEINICDTLDFGFRTLNCQNHLCIKSPLWLKTPQNGGHTRYFGRASDWQSDVKRFHPVRFQFNQIVFILQRV